MIKTGIMGGTFDPIHNGHLIIARYAYEQLGLDEIWFMTSGNPPHKRDRGHTKAAIRHEMLELAIDGCNGFVPCDYEVRRSEYSYSALTLEHFKEEYPDREFYFIIGQDSLHYLDKWYMPEKIVSLAKIPVYPRASDINLDEDIRAMSESLDTEFIKIDAPLFGISSTEIRKRVSEGKSISFMVPERVEEYIIEKGLYK